MPQNPQPLLLSGQQEYVSPESVDESRWRRVQELRDDLDQFMEQTLAAMSIIRNQLDTIRAGLSHAAGEVVVTSGVSAPQVEQKWDFWKKRYPGRVAEAIDLLLHQSEMNITQMCSALRCDPRTLSAKVIYPLNKAGLINKNGGKYSLKEL